jgi:hypothetical protein
MDGVWVAAGDEIAAWVATLDLPPVIHEPPRLRERPGAGSTVVRRGTASCEIGDTIQTPRV